MLIKLTSKCTMGCAHCMEDAREDGDAMTMEAFKLAVLFGLYIRCGVFALSGGEPTENEKIADMCEWLDATVHKMGFVFSIVSNGMWLKDERKRKCVERICRLPSFSGMQVYTNRLWYREYDYVTSHRAEYERYPHVIVDADSKIFMQDLGRARISEAAQQEAAKNPYFMSCLNAALCARQVYEPSDYGLALALQAKFCKPQVDALGFVHMSESRLCPNVGNVCTDDFADIWRRMREFRPYGGCRGYRNFIESQRLDIARAKEVLGVE